MSDAPLLNYDPSRYGQNLATCVEVLVIRSDGTSYPVLCAVDSLSRLPVSEQNAAIIATIRIYESVAAFVRGGNHPSSPNIISKLCWYAARAIACNVMDVYCSRAPVEEVIDRRGVLDDETYGSWFERVWKREYAWLTRAIKSSDGVSGELEDVVWVNLLGSLVIRLLEEGKMALTDSERQFCGALARHVTSSDLMNYDYVVEGVAEDYASRILNLIAPSRMPIEELRAFILQGPETRLSDEQLENLIKRLDRCDSKKATYRQTEDGGIKFAFCVESVDGRADKFLQPPKPGRTPIEGRQSKREEFAASVVKKRDLAHYLSEFASRQIHCDWRKQLESDPTYNKEFCRGYDRTVIREAERELDRYLAATALSETVKNHAKSPLGVAKLITAVEMNLRNSDGSLLSITTLDDWYTKGGGKRWSA